MYGWVRCVRLSVAGGIMVVEVCDAAVSSVIVVVSHRQWGDSAGGLVMW